MFEDVYRDSNTRLSEIRTYLGSIAKATNIGNNPMTSANLSIAKGLFFVHLYGAYEYAVTSAVLETIQGINTAGCRIADCNPMLFSLVLHPECMSLAAVGPEKTFQKRWELFSLVSSPQLARIPDGLMPTDGKNIRYEQLESICKSFCVQEPVVPDMMLKGRVEELVENRNAIAHGRLSPRDVGGRYTVPELVKRLDDIEELCLHLILTLQDHVENGKYRI